MLSRKTILKIKSAIRSMGFDVSRVNTVLEKSVASPLSIHDMLALYFKSIDPDDFYLLQIGANDGLMQDPLRPFIRKYALKGCLVEPQPNVFETLKQNYADQPQLHFANCAVSAEEGDMTLYSFPDDLRIDDLDMGFSGFASFDRDHVVRAFDNHAVRGGIKGRAEDYLLEITVKTKPIESIIKESGQPRIDFLQIDTEGFDFEIIKLFNFTTYQPEVIVYEHHSLSPDDRIACWDDLNQKGYQCVVDGIDTLAYKND